VHGGPATVKAVLKAIPQCAPASNIRYAEPGEFTRRAFQNNRLDLAQVEALSDTLSAETEQQRRAAVRGNSGTLGRTYEAWRQQLLEARGELEAIIDFSEDQYFETSNRELLQNISRLIGSILDSIEVHEEGSRRGELLRKGIRISLLGHPNAGKSSLLNLIVGREASIVSTEAGTTRDVVAVSLDIEGYLCTFADTAGLRSEPAGHDNGSQIEQELVGKVELEGIRRAKAIAEDSDIVIVLASVEPSPTEDLGWAIRCDLEALQIASRAERSLTVVNKVDLVSDSIFEQLVQGFKQFLSREGLKNQIENIIPVSCRAARENRVSAQNPGNLKSLVSGLVATFKEMTIFEDEHLLGVTERQRQLLKECQTHCEAYARQTQEASDEDVETESDVDVVIAAEHLRSAANCLSRITGRGEANDIEEVLGVVFEK
jgi:tRNA modification GTPase